MNEEVQRIPEALEGHVHAQDHAHAQERPEPHFSREAVAPLGTTEVLGRGWGTL